MLRAALRPNSGHSGGDAVVPKAAVRSPYLATDFLARTLPRRAGCFASYLRPGQSRPWRKIMGYSRYNPATQSRPAWNAGKNVGAKRPLTQKQIWAVPLFLERESRIRDRALFDLAIDSKLRGCDLVKIKIGDVVSGTEIKDSCYRHSAKDRPARPV